MVAFKYGGQMAGPDAQKKELADKLLSIVAKEGMIEGEIDLDAELNSLSIQSADVVMILMAIEEEFGIYISVDEDLTETRTVRELIDLFVPRIIEHQNKASD